MSATVAPGWYDDPSGTGLQRWWSGINWTEHTHNPAPPPPAASAHPAGNFGYTASSYKPMSNTPQLPPTAMSGQPTRVGSASGNTFGVWMIATSPFWAGLISAPLALLGDPGLIVTLVLFIGLAFLFAWRDGVALRARGIATPSIAWMLLTPFGYLIARRIVLKRDGVRSNAPGNVFVIPMLFGFIGGLTFAALAAANPGLLSAYTTSRSLTTLEQQASSQLGAQTNTSWTVTCPVEAPVTVTGATFVCQASDTTGRTAQIQAKVTTPGRFTISLLPAATNS